MIRAFLGSSTYQLGNKVAVRAEIGLSAGNTGSQELQESIEQPGRSRAQSGRLAP